MVKRKRGDPLEGFDPNASDPEDDTFELQAVSPSQSRKKSRAVKTHRPTGRKRNKYRGSDIEDDEELDDSEEEGSFDEGGNDDDDDD